MERSYFSVHYVSMLGRSLRRQKSFQCRATVDFMRHSSRPLCTGIGRYPRALNKSVTQLVQQFGATAATRFRHPHRNQVAVRDAPLFPHSWRVPLAGLLNAAECTDGGGHSKGWPQLGLTPALRSGWPGARFLPHRLRRVPSTSPQWLGLASRCVGAITLSEASSYKEKPRRSGVEWEESSIRCYGLVAGAGAVDGGVVVCGAVFVFGPGRAGPVVVLCSP